MKALQVQGNSVVTITEITEPIPGPGEVVIQSAVSALCGSELKSYRGDGKPSGNTGHEGAGIVVELGPEVGGLERGQRVGVSAVTGCGHCDYCAKGQYTWCHEHQAYSDMHAERFIASARACHPLPDDVPFDMGVLITGDALGVPYHTSTRMRDEEVKTVAVFGVGPIGLGNTLLQSYLGRRIIAVDIVSTRLELAEKLGAAHTLNSSETDPVEGIQSLTEGRGADVCIDAAGKPQTAMSCFAAARPGGTVVFNGEQSALELSPSADFIRRDIGAFGSWYYHFSEFKEMLALYREGLRLADFVTHRFDFPDAGEAFEKFAAGETGKVLLIHEGFRD